MRRRTLPDAFKDAADGIAAAFAEQPNFRIQIAAGTAAVIAAAALHFEFERWAVLALLIGLVLVAELFNTALEHIVDLVQSEPHPLARAAKHAGAGAVLAVSITVTLIGLWLFGTALHERLAGL